MGRKERVKPERLADKLKVIRTELDLTAEELIERLDCPRITLYRSSISDFENGKREPPLIILLRYSRIANVSVESLIDDEINLPEIKN